MKKLYIAALIAIVMASCTKKTDRCYTCEVVTSCSGYQVRTVCTDGDPQSELPQHDDCGNTIHWSCKAK